MSSLDYTNNPNEQAAAAERAMFRTKAVEEIFNELNSHDEQTSWRDYITNNRAPNDVGGTLVPFDVLSQLREIGISPENCPQGGALNELIAACADGRLIEDPEGVNFEDKLKLTPDEVAARRAKRDSDNDGIPDDEDEMPYHDQRQHKSFLKTLVEGRINKAIAIACGAGNGSEVCPDM